MSKTERAAKNHNQKKKPLINGGQASIIIAGVIGIAGIGLITKNTIEGQSHHDTSVETDEYILSQFPELRDTRILTSGTIDTQDSPIHWLSTTKVKVNEESVKAAFNYFHGLSQRGLNFVMKSEFGEERFTTWTLDKDERFVYFKENNTPNASIIESSDAYTIVSSEPNSTTSVITILQPDNKVLNNFFNTPERRANMAFFVESCQSSISMVNDQGSMGNRDAQEIFCNSLGIAFAAKQYGLQYQEYLQIINTTKIFVPAAGKLVRPQSVPENEYNQIEFVGLAVELIN